MIEKHEHECTPDRQAYSILRFTYAFLPIVAGADKFFNYLTDWGQYLSSAFTVLGTTQSTMLLVGAIEIIAGIGVWLKPKLFSYVVALWLLGIIVNLLVLGKFYDIALRDLGLLLGALALGRLSCHYAYCGTSSFHTDKTKINTDKTNIDFKNTPTK